MKKLIGTAMLAALLATSAFAELSVGVWLRQLWSPVAYNGGDVKTGIQNSWGNSRTASVGLNWVGDDEKAGATLSIIGSAWWDTEYKLKYDKDATEEAKKWSLSGGIPIILDGNNLIWVKPWDFLKVSLGHWDGINDIQVANTSSWDWLRPGTWLSFKGVRTDNLYCENEATGALFEITPMESLMVRVGLPFDASDLSYHMFEALTADVEYIIPDIAKIMVGWRGGRYSYTPSWGGGYTDYKVNGDWTVTGEVDAYASLLAVENLQLEVGARIAILDTDIIKKTEEADKVLIGVKAGYNITDNIGVKADFAIKISEIQDPSFAFGVGVGVGLTDSLSLDADFRGVIPGDTNGKSADPTFSFLVGLNYVCSSNASVGIGFQGKTNGGGIGPLDANGDNFGFAVPIKVQVSF